MILKYLNAKMASNDQEYSLSELVNTDIRAPIPTPIVEQVLCKEPFTAVPGVINIRDLGVYASPFIGRGVAYRCGALSQLTDEGKTILAKDLGIKLILNLRSGTETSKDPEPDIEGVKSLWLPCTQQPLPVDLNDFVGDDGKKGYLKMYGDVLDIYKPSFRAVLEHLKDDRGPVLFHCSGEIYPLWFHSKQSPDVSILKSSWQGPHRYIGRRSYGARRMLPRHHRPRLCSLSCWDRASPGDATQDPVAVGEGLG